MEMLHIPAHDADQTEGLGITEHVAIDRDGDAPYFPEPPAIHDDPVLEMHGESQAEDDGVTPSKGPKPRWRDHFPHPAGRRLRREPTAFESLLDAQVAQGGSIWGKFSDEDDWNFARWILRSGTTHTSTDDLLELKKVSRRKIVIEYKTY